MEVAATISMAQVLHMVAILELNPAFMPSLGVGLSIGIASGIEVSRWW